MKKIRILQINAVYGHGSTGTIVRDIEHLCYQNNIECFVASPDPMVTNANNGYVIGNIIDHKLHAILARANGAHAYFSHIPTFQLCRYIDKIQPDIVHIHNVHSNYLHFNMLLGHLAKRDIKTVLTLHDCWAYTGGCYHYTSVNCDRWQKTCGKCPKKMMDTPAFFLDISSKILADRKKYIMSIPRLIITGVSKWISDECKKSVLKDAKIITIHNGVDLDIFKPTPIPDSSLDLRNLKVSLSGKRIILAPATKWLLPINRKVLDYFSSHMNDSDVLLLYGVYDTPPLLPPNVVAYGYTKSREDMAALYTMADVLVNCSREESLSLVNVECQACGTPVVTFDATAPKETVDNINSFSVKAGDEKELFRMTLSILENKAQEKSEACRSFVEKKFEINKNYQKYIELYRTL
ncbi:MAG: glycosyltransferase [Bacteroidaceae bacterium]|nr:glycosyltransferase [Bacteroidaceae bacterium]